MESNENIGCESVKSRYPKKRIAGLSGIGDPFFIFFRIAQDHSR